MAATSTAAICEEQVQVRRERRPCAGPRGVTLGQFLSRAHDAAVAGQTAGCPMCGGAMEPAGREARCGGCGTRLS